MKAEDKYLVRGGNNPRGPFTVAELRQQFARGLISPDAECWRDGLKTWIPVAVLVGAHPKHNSGPVQIAAKSISSLDHCDSRKPLTKSASAPPNADTCEMTEALGKLIVMLVGIVLAFIPLLLSICKLIPPEAGIISSPIGLLLVLLVLLSVQNAVQPRAVLRDMVIILLQKPWLRFSIGGGASAFMACATILCLFGVKDSSGLKTKLSFGLGAVICAFWSWEMACFALARPGVVQAIKRRLDLD